MRVIGGRFRGLKLSAFEGENIRPTADRVKESLFNILSFRIEGADVLDLFCGSGNLGIECLSRGAASVHFNDVSKESLSVLSKNLNKLKNVHNYFITNLNYSACLETSKQYSVIFLDPPYAADFGVRALEAIGEKKLLAENGAAVLERGESFAGSVRGLELYDERKYGKTYLSFFRASGGE